MERFYLGTHIPGWLAHEDFTDVPLFVSRRRLEKIKKLPRARGRWALDSGGFTELSMHGRWCVRPHEYIALVRRFSAEIGNMDWAAPQDWMCEEVITQKTRRTRWEHIARTVQNLLELRALAPDLPFVPVLQGLDEADYERCAEMYELAGVRLADEATIGLGTICRRQGTLEAEKIVRRFARDGLRLHAFGAKVTGLRRYHGALRSSDSMAWSFGARREAPLPGCIGHKNCANCKVYALRWRARLLAGLA